MDPSVWAYVLLSVAGLLILTRVVGAWVDKRATRRRLDAWAASAPTPSYGGSWREPGAGQAPAASDARRANDLRNQTEVERLRRAEQLRNASVDDSGWFASLHQTIHSSLSSIADSSDCGSSSSSDHGCGGSSSCSSSDGGSSSCGGSSCGGSSCGGGGD